MGFKLDEKRIIRLTVSGPHTYWAKMQISSYREPLAFSLAKVHALLLYLWQAFSVLSILSYSTDTPYQVQVCDTLQPARPSQGNQWPLLVCGAEGCREERGCPAPPLLGEMVYPWTSSCFGIKSFLDFLLLHETTSAPDERRCLLKSPLCFL